MERMDIRNKVLKTLQLLNIVYDIYEHPEAPTIEIAREYWAVIPKEVKHCKNLFFRNHKGNKHYLVIFDCEQNLAIHDLEQKLKQGKLSFASEERMMKYLGLSPGSVSPFGLINDKEHHVHIFLDKNLRNAKRLSFHPNENTASVVIENIDLIRFLEYCKNTYEFIALY